MIVFALESSVIKIKGTNLYVKNVVHGSIVGSVFSVAQKDQHDCSSSPKGQSVQYRLTFSMLF